METCTFELDTRYQRLHFV